MPKTSPSERPKVNLDAVLASRYADFELGGITFAGRPMGWTVALEFDGKTPSEQFDVLIRALRSRASDPEALTDAWVEDYLTRPAVDAIVGLLFRNERPSAD